MLAPAGILREPFYKIFQNVGPCGHIKGALLQNSQNSRRVGRVVSKNGFTGTYFGFDICNPKLFTFKNRSSIVPSLQNLYFIHLFNDFHVKKKSYSKKCRKSILTGATIRKQIRWIKIFYPFWLKPSKMTCFWRFSFFIFSFFVFFYMLGSAAWGFSL